MPPLSASIGSFIEKPMIASTCFHQQGLNPEADIDQLDLLELNAVGGEKREETLEGRAPFLGAELHPFEQLARIGHRLVLRTDEDDRRALIVGGDGLRRHTL